MPTLPPTLKQKILKKQNSSEKEFLILCEPEEGIKDIYSEAYEKIVKEYKWVKEGIEVFEELSKTRCEILILEMMISNINGMEVLKILRKDLKLKFPIIVLTNMSSPKAMDEAFSLGANEYLIKTEIDSEILKNVIKKHMKKKQEINLFSLQKFLKGRKWKDLTKKERLEISGEILKRMFPESPKK